MRRRKVDMLSDNLGEALKSEAKGLFGVLIKMFLSKIVAILVKVLVGKNWVDVTDDFEE